MAFTYYYSPSLRGFYLKEVHGEHGIPHDAVPVEQAEHRRLIEAQSKFEIVPGDDGRPVLQARVRGKPLGSGA
jgi:hypothetical protein